MNRELERHREYAIGEASAIAHALVAKHSPMNGMVDPAILAAIVIAAGSIYAARLGSMHCGPLALPSPEL